MNLEKSTDKFEKIKVELIAFYLLKSNSNKYFKAPGMNFNWGIIWSGLSPLIIVAGWTLLFTLGVKGRGFDLSYFVFILLFSLGFNRLVSQLVKYKLEPIFFNKKETNIFNTSLALYEAEFYQLLLRFFVLIFILEIFNFKLEYYYLIYGCLIISALGFFYGIAINSIFKNNKFLSDIHSYFLTAIFLTSSVILPLDRLSESIRNVFLYNPIAHVNEWIKSASTGVTYEYINIFYPLKLILFLAIISPIFLWFMKNNQLSK